MCVLFKYDGSSFVYFVVEKYKNEQKEKKLSNIYVHTYTNAVLNISKLENSWNRTVTLPKCFKIFAIYKNVAHSLDHNETPSNSVSLQDPNYIQRW